jgi:hypothetical protein
MLQSATVINVDAVQAFTAPYPSNGTMAGASGANTPSFTVRFVVRVE